MKMKKYWILVAMSGTCLLWSAQAWGSEQGHIGPDYAGGYWGQVGGKNFSSHPDYAGGYWIQVDGKQGHIGPDYAGGQFGQIGGQSFSSHPDYAGGQFGQIGGQSFSSHPDYAGGYWIQVDGGYSGYSGYGGYKGNRIGGNGVEHSFIPMATAPMAGQSVGGNEIENFSSTGNKPIGGRIMTTTNSKMTIDRLGFDNQLERDSAMRKTIRPYPMVQFNKQSERDLAAQQIEQRNREIAEREMAEDLLVKQKIWREKNRKLYEEIHAKQAELPKPDKGTITGIAYSENSASALLNSQIIHEGDIIQGIKVVKIRKGAIEFEKDGKKWTQRVGETPAPYWE